MMRYNNIINGLLAIASILAFTACTEDTAYDDNVAEGNGVFRFSGAPSIYTRANASADYQEQFETGTKYQLFAIEARNWSTNYLQKNPSKNAIEGTEAADHTISFDGNNKFNNHSLDFYAVTLSDKTLVPDIKYNSNGAPTCHVSYDNGALTDVMWSGNLKNQTYKNSGKLQLNFEHTLSKLHVYAQKNDELTGSTVVLKEVKLIDYLSGDLSLETGEFSSETDTRVDNAEHAHSVYTGTAVINEETAKKEIFSAMAFPTRGTETDSHALGLKVTTTVDGKNEKTTTYRIKEVDVEHTTDNKNPKYKAFKFKPNYEYDIVLTMTQTTMVVTVILRVYDWIDDNSDYEDTQIGSSVTFGGVTWMDRNLGATSADATKSIQSWEASRGFYYQFGRSIPYYLNGSCLDPSVKDPSKGPKCVGSRKSENAKPFPYIPGHYNVAQRTDNNYGYNDCAQDPGEKDKSFSFSSSEYENYGRDWASDHSVSATYWNNSVNQPCPKGWRLPTKDEFLSIVPSSQNAGDITFLNHNGTYSETEYNDVHNEKAVYVGVPEKKQSWGTIYAIKRQGTSNAYRVRWQIKRVGNTSNEGDRCDTGGDAQGYRSVLVISRYPAKKDSELTTTNYKTSYTDWDNPVETLMLPISGYIHVDGGAALIYAGSEAIYHTSTADTNNNKFWSFRIKFSGDKPYRYLYMWNDERRGYGCSVRCVRDKNVN